MAEYNHIEFERESVVRKYRFRPFPNAPVAPRRDRQLHGKKLSNEIDASVSDIEKNRLQHGVDSKKLVVLEFEGIAISSGIIDQLLRSFSVSLVEESPADDKSISKLVLQFDSLEDIEKFNFERACFERDDHKRHILTYAQRRDLFNSITNIRKLQRKDRMGARLKRLVEDGFESQGGVFVVDIDVWYNGSNDSIPEIENQIKIVLGTGESRLLGDLFELPSILLGRVQVDQFSLNALLDLDIIASVELPNGNILTEASGLYANEQIQRIINNLGEDSPIAAVIDSGIYSANPLLDGVIVAEEDFDLSENTTSDLNGHGTGVAGIVAYGDLQRYMISGEFKPQVRLLSGKVLHNGENGAAVFPIEKRPEVIVKEAIEHFYINYGCRVYNVSLGDSDHVYAGGRQFAWANVLDQLIRDLDIVIIISAGNVNTPQIIDFNSRDELIANTQNSLFNPEHRIIDPATSALAITVGSISRHEQPQAIRNRAARLPVGYKNYLSAFTRIGKGVNKAIKPELVDYGGNYAIHQITRGDSRWIKSDTSLMELTLNNTSETIFKGYCGTSFSAPHVTNYAAQVERALRNQLGRDASSNLIRAMVINTAEYEEKAKEWYESSVDPHYSGNNNPKQDRRMRLAGFGRANADILFSTDNRVTVFAEDDLELRSFHLYKVPVPQEFIGIKANKRISISLAYDPVTRVSRKEYLSNNLWFEVFRRIDEDTLLRYKEKKESGDNTEADRYLDSLPDNHKASFTPGSDKIRKGTLQQRVWEKGSRGGSDLLWGDEDPYIYILVTGKGLFKYDEQSLPQKYALVATFSYDSTDDIGLYNLIKNKVRVKEREVVRERVQTQTIR